MTACSPCISRLQENGAQAAGTVSRVEGKDFHLKAGDEIIRVSVDEPADNPLNGEGHPQIEEGDRVEVVGKISTGLVEGRLLEAYSIVELQDD
jgi:hypothetical protein